MARLTILLFGALQVFLDGRPVTAFATDKTRALLAYLSIETEYPHRRDALAGLLWPDHPQRRARQNLRQTLLYLRQAIDSQDDSRSFLVVEGDTIRFDEESEHFLDVAEFVELIEATMTHRHRRLGACLPCIEKLEQALELHRGSFLAHFSLSDSDIFEEWLTLKREWLQRQALEALFSLSSYYERQGNSNKAVRYAQRQIELEPWSEEAHRQLMRLLAASGRRSAAMFQYETCRRLLARELDLEPTSKTTELYEQIRAGKELALSIPPHNLPPAQTPFVGREAELVELTNMLVDPDCRLLSLVGPGGIGKSRLALELAAGQVGNFSHGVYFVSLASIASAELVVPTIADALGFDLGGYQDSQQQLLSYLRDRELLLVLDNMEHLLESVDLLADILHSAPKVVLLVTSRERINLKEEWVREIGGLAFPEDCTAPKGEQCSAVALFVQSARRVQHAFMLSAKVRPHVIRICQLLQGMPLGIELAAAWVATIPCETIAREIEQDIDLLTTTLRNVPERHQSLRATFEHSWNLLSDREQQVLRGSSVFRGGFTENAAEYVVGDRSAILARLVSKSLLGQDTGARYQFHQLLYQYAAEKLTAVPQQRDLLHERHVDYYSTFLQRREEGLKRGNQLEALKEIKIEIDNVRQAWRWVLHQIERGQNTPALLSTLEQAMESLYLFYTIQGWYQEGEEAFRQAVSVLDHSLDLDRSLFRERELIVGKLLARQAKCCEFTEHSDKAEYLYERSLSTLRRIDAWHESALPLHGLGYMHHIKGQYDQATKYYQESRTVYRQIQDPWGEGNVLGGLCLTARRQGAFSTAREYCQESLRIRQAIGDQRGVAASLNTLGLICCAVGEYAEAKELFQQALQVCQRLDYKVGIAHALTGLTQATFRLGEIDQAERFGHETLATYREIGDLWGVAIAFNNLGRMSAELGDDARAKRFYQKGVAIYRQIGIKSGLANTLGNLGETCYNLGEEQSASEYLLEALKIAWEIEAIPAVLENLVGLVPCLVKMGETGPSLELLVFVSRHLSAEHAVREKADNLFAELSAGCSPQVVAAARAKAEGMDLKVVIQSTIEWIERQPK